jgi:hypothetical protein
MVESAGQVAQTERLDWTSAELHGGFVDGAILVVEGDTPVPMQVELHPLPIGIVPVDYQGIELRGSRGDAGPEVVTHFHLSVDTKHLPHGKVGFVLIGATMHQYFPPKDD